MSVQFSTPKTKSKSSTKSIQLAPKRKNSRNVDEAQRSPKKSKHDIVENNDNDTNSVVGVVASTSDFSADFINQLAHDRAVREGDLNMVKHTRELGANWYIALTTVAAVNGYLDIMKYATENYCHWHQNTISKAITSNQMECLKYAMMNGCPLTSNDLLLIIRNCSFDIFVLALQCNCPWSEEVSHALILKDDGLQYIKYAYEQQYPFHPKITSIAAAENKLDIMKFAREIGGCSWSYSTTLEAVLNNNYDCLVYALSNGCPLHCNTVSSCHGKNSIKMKMFQYLNSIATDQAQFWNSGLQMIKHINFNDLYWSDYVDQYILSYKFKKFPASIQAAIYKHKWCNCTNHSQ